MDTSNDKNIGTNSSQEPDKQPDIHKSSLPDFGHTAPPAAILPDFGLNTIPPPPQREEPKFPLTGGSVGD